jgi:hypothetical protein
LTVTIFNFQCSISIAKSQPQISQVLWRITDDFCRRIIVIDGRILSVLIANKLWLPSGIKIISSKSVSGNESIKSVAIGNMSKLERIEKEAFKEDES